MSFTVAINERPESVLKKMCQMEPYEIGEIVESDFYKGHIVMRTANKNHFEVMDLSMSEEGGGHWDQSCPLVVRIFPPGTEITITVTKGKGCRGGCHACRKSSPRKV